MILRAISLAYWAFCYVVFLGTFAYLVGFIGNRYTFSTIDSGLQLPFRDALLIDLGLLALFFTQHSVMARNWFKSGWRRWLPKDIERSSYVLAASLALVLLFFKWEPMPELIWRIEQPLARAVLQGLFWLGWITVIVSSFLSGHWELAGLKQALRRDDQPGFRVAGPYRWVRHPMMIGLMLGFWATPEMSRGHLLFASANLLYVMVAVRWEERDLARELGPEYVRYRGRVGRWFPFSRV
jgi:protein-S-isoprenylcysteine O-methyltransferase Ste14